MRRWAATISRATAAGFAAGADYRVSPGSVIGMAVAIGETRWNVSGVGKGDADVAQIGGYFSSRWDSLYVSGAVALAWHRASTDRTLNIAGTDRLEADFNATSFGGRLEGGYRYGSVNLGLTPYAAVQVHRHPHAVLHRSRHVRLEPVRARLHRAIGERHPQRARLLGRHPARVRQRRAGHAARPRRLGARLQSRQPRSRPRSRRCPAPASWSTAQRPRATRR